MATGGGEGAFLKFSSFGGIAFIGSKIGVERGGVQFFVYLLFVCFSFFHFLSLFLCLFHSFMVYCFY